MNPLPGGVGSVCSLDELIKSEKVSVRQIYDGCPTEAARAAVITALESEPERDVIVIAELEQDGETADGWSADAILHLFHGVNASAVVFACPRNPARLPGLLEELLQNTKIPVGVLIPSGLEEEMLPRLTSSRITVSPSSEGVDTMRRLLKSMESDEDIPFIADYEDLVDDAVQLVAVSNGEAHYIDAAIDIEAECDIADEEVVFAEWIVEQEDENWGAIRVMVSAEDELSIFTENQYMIKVPLVLSSHSIEYLAKAVRNFCGIAIYDGTSELDEEQVFDLHRRYGLIIL